MIRYIDIHTHQKTKRDEEILSLQCVPLPLKGKVPGYPFSAGWHPWQIEGRPIPEIEKQLNCVLREPRLVAIGECGLDRTIKTPFEFQKAVFRLHLTMATNYSKPVIVHCVRAISDLLQIIKSSKSLPPLILHGFNGNASEADQLIKKSCFLSFGKSILSENPKMKQVLKLVPVGFIFFETDDEEISVKAIYKQAAGLLNINIEDLQNIIIQNFIRLFGNGLVGQNPVVTG